MIWPGPRTTADLWMGFLDPYHNKYQTGGLQHLLARHIRQEVGPDVFSSYFKFTIVRNPWDKAVSQFSYMDSRDDLRHFIGMKKGDSFKRYVDLIMGKRHVQWEPQVSFLRDQNGEPLVDYVGRFETFPQSVSEVLKTIGIGVHTIPHDNAARRGPYQEYYDDESREMIAALYSADIEAFGYTFAGEGARANLTDPAARQNTAAPSPPRGRNMATRRHVVIAGTGRTGTTFLVELLTHLGLDTGFSAQTMESKKSKEARAGLEHDIRREGCPYIVKNPTFHEYAAEILQREDIGIDHVLIPMRDLYAAAESRRFVEQDTLAQMSFAERLAVAESKEPLPGGLWLTYSTEPGEQERILLWQFYDLLLALCDAAVPMTFMRFPRIVKDCPYLFEKLKPILGDIGYESFAAAFDKTARPELVHNFSENDR